MPVQAGMPGQFQTLTPTTDWQIMAAPVPKDRFEVATDRFYVDVSVR